MDILHHKPVYQVSCWNYPEMEPKLDKHFLIYHLNYQHTIRSKWRQCRFSAQLVIDFYQANYGSGKQVDTQQLLVKKRRIEQMQGWSHSKLF